ncbi:MAG: YHS domain-containing (seleno)protein [Saonia sp.]
MNIKKIKLLGLIFITSSLLVNAQKVNTNKDKIANNGYDVVNYFTENTAKRGSKEFSMTHKDAIYYFSSSDNLKAFKTNPKKYLPMYDGYCAFAVAQMNQKVTVDPETFRVDDGKLYLFFNDYYEGKPFNTIVPWINNEAKMEKMAEVNWVKIKDN